MDTAAVTLIFSLSCGLVEGMSVSTETLVEQQYKNCTYQEHMEHTCWKGQYVNDGRCDELRECCHCPPHTWMPSFNNCPQCIPHTDCASLGTELISAGNRTHDNVCGDKLVPATTHLISIQDVTSVHPPLATTSTTQQQRILSEQQTSPPQNGPSTPSGQLSSSPSWDGHDLNDWVTDDSRELVTFLAVMCILTSVLLIVSAAGNVFLLRSLYRQRRALEEDRV